MLETVPGKEHYFNQPVFLPTIEGFIRRERITTLGKDWYSFSHEGIHTPEHYFTFAEAVEASRHMLEAEVEKARVALAAAERFRDEKLAMLDRHREVPTQGKRVDPKYQPMQTVYVVAAPATTGVEQAREALFSVMRTKVGYIHLSGDRCYYHLGSGLYVQEQFLRGTLREAKEALQKVFNKETGGTLPLNKILVQNV